MSKRSPSPRCCLGPALCAAVPLALILAPGAPGRSAQALLSPSTSRPEVADAPELWPRSALGRTGGAGGQAPTAGQGSTRPRPEETRPHGSAEGPATLLVFEFHSGFWVNLHHFLYHEAQRLRGGERTADLREPLENTSGLSGKERQAWAASLDYYANHLAGRDLLFNSDLVAIKNRLAEIEAEPDLQKSGLQPELVAALERAAPIYRAHGWIEQDRANRAWVAAATPLIERLGGVLAEKLAAVYQAQWPAGRVGVDVSYYANPAGAYTTLEPLHITISSSAEANQGPAAVEVLFHEASHALAGAVRDAIARECRARNKPIPRDLWHALLFYTTGEIVRRALGGPEGLLAKSGAPAGGPSGHYTPYAYRYGLYARGWQNYLQVLERYWQPYLDGKTDFDRAIAQMVAAL